MFFRYDLKEAEALAKKLGPANSDSAVPEKKTNAGAVLKEDATESTHIGEDRSSVPFF